MIQDGQADIFMCHTSPNNGDVTELSMTTDVVMNGFSDEIVDGWIKRGFAERDIRGTFGHFDKPVRTGYIGTSLIVRADMDDALAYTLAKLFMENVKELGEDNAMFKNLTYKVATDPTITVVPFHPGALAYFKEVGAVDASGKFIGEPK
jgi:TRAP-type uncharacterized transport system substrate-binding protein